MERHSRSQKESLAGHHGVPPKEGASIPEKLLGPFLTQSSGSPGKGSAEQVRLLNQELLQRLVLAPDRWHYPLAECSFMACSLDSWGMPGEHERRLSQEGPKQTTFPKT